MKKKKQPTNNNRTLNYWTQEIDQLCIDSVTRKLTEDEYTTLYGAMKKLTVTVWANDTRPRLNIPESEKDQIIHDTTTHIMSYTLDRFRPERLNGKLCNFFVRCIRNELHHASWNWVNNSNKHVPMSAFSDEGNEDSGMKFKTADSFNWGEQATHIVFDAMERVFKETIEYYKQNPPHTNKHTIMLAAFEKTLAGELPFILRKRSKHDSIYLYDNIMDYVSQRCMTWDRQSTIGATIKNLIARYLIQKHGIKLTDGRDSHRLKKALFELFKLEVQYQKELIENK